MLIHKFFKRTISSFMLCDILVIDHIFDILVIDFVTLIHKFVYSSEQFLTIKLAL